jgi:hypothetical protein
MEQTIKFNGISGIIALVAVIGFVLFRIATMGNNTDPDLEKAVRQELLSDSAGASVETLKAMWKNRTLGKDSIKKLDPFNIDILKLSSSQPLFSTSSNERVIVYVKYMIPSRSEPMERYMEFTHYALGNRWRYNYDTSNISYYFNLF